MKIKKYITLLIIPLIFMCNGLNAQSAEDKTKINIAALSDNASFDNAKLLYKLKEYSRAVELLNEYLEVYINGLHRKEAYKYIASIYFEQFNYIKSIKIYKSLYEEFSNSEEGIEGFFMTGICYQKMGFLDKAKATFKTLIDEHPSSNYAYQSKIKLDLIEILERS